MSNYHEKCTSKQGKKQEKMQAPVKLKPFCDCNDCTSKDCPDILNRLGITVTDKTCDFGHKDGGSGSAKRATK